MLCSQHSQEEGQLVSEGSSLSWKRPLPVWQLPPIFRLLWHSTTGSFRTLKVSFLVCLCFFSHLFFYFFILFLIGGKLLYTIVLVSAIHQHESAIGYTYAPSLLNLPRTSDPTVPLSGCHRTPGLNSLHHKANSHWLAILNMVMYMFQCHSFNPSHPLLPTLGPQCVLYVCISTAALQIGSSVPSF